MDTAADFLKWLLVFGVKYGGGGGGGVTEYQVQQAVFNNGVDTGPDGTTYQVVLSPPPLAYTNGLTVTFVPAHTNTILIPTLAIGALPAMPIVTDGQFLIQNGSIAINVNATVQYSTYLGAWLLQNPATVSPALTAANILVGNALNVGAAVPMTGDGSISDTGLLTITGLNGTTLTFSNNEVLATNNTGVPAFTATLPAQVQTNITALGVQSQALSMGGYQINNLATPTLASDAATKGYADSIAGGLNPIPGVYAASTANLTGYTYLNGSGGVGATLTAGSTGVFTLDGTTPPVGTAVLYKDDSTGSGAYNGIYIVTTSSGGSAAVLTRATYYDTIAQIQPGDWIAVENGSINVTGSSFIQTATVATVGVSPLTFSLFFSPANYLPLSGGTMSGALSMGSNFIHTVTDPVSAQDAATKHYVDTTAGAYLPLAGGTMAGVINMAGYYLTGVPGLKDANNNVALGIISVPSAVNYINVTNQSTGNSPNITATGSDANVIFNIFSKGGTFVFHDITATNPATILLGSASGTNYVGLAAPASISANVIYQWPGAGPSFTGYVLSSTTAGVLSWIPNGTGTFLPLAGGTMAGVINAGGFSITDLAGVKGANDKQVVAFSDNAASFNWLEITAPLPGEPVLIDAIGTDLIVYMNLRTKGGGFYLSDLTGTVAPSLSWFDIAGTNAVAWKAPDSLLGNTLYEWPGAYPLVNGYVLSSTTAGVTSWVPQSGGGGISATDIQNQTLVTSLDTGAANAYVLTISPAITAVADFQKIGFIAANNNTGVSTVTINAQPPYTIVNPDSSSLTNGAIISGVYYEIVYNTGYGAYVLLSASNAGVTPFQIQQSAFNSGADTGGINTYQTILNPAIVTLTEGITVNLLNVANGNTGASTLDVNGTPTPITTLQGSALSGGELIATMDYTLVFNVASNSFILQNPSLSASGVTPDQIQRQVFTFAADSGVPNAVVLALSPTITSNTYVAVSFLCGSVNTGATTIDCGLGAVPLVLNGNVPLIGGELQVFGSYSAVYNNAYSSYILLNPSSSVTPLAVQSWAFNSVGDSGSANASAMVLSPALGTLQDGQIVELISKGGTNTGAVTLNANGTPLPVLNLQGAALTGGEILSGNSYTFIYNGTLVAWILQVDCNLSVANVQISKYNSTYDAGSVNAYSGVFSPPITTLTDGMIVTLLSLTASNTSSCTLDINGTPQSIFDLQGLGLVGGEMLISTDYNFQWNAGLNAFTLLNSSSVQATPIDVQGMVFNSSADSGAINAYVASPTPALSALTIKDGTIITLTSTSSSNSGPSTFNAVSVGALPVVSLSGAALVGGEILAGYGYNFQYNLGSNQWVLLNSSIPYLPLSGGTMTGSITITGANGISFPSGYGIYDAAFNPVLSFLGSSVPVNSWTMSNGDTGNAIQMSAAGSDTDIIMSLDGKGVGNVQIGATKTNDNATPGYLGEYYESVVLQGAGVSLTNNTIVDVATITGITGGNWTLKGNVNFLGGAGTAVTLLQGWVSLVSATSPNGAYTATFPISMTLGANNFGFVVPEMNLNLVAGSYTVYLSTYQLFTVGTLEGSGKISIERPR